MEGVKNNFPFWDTTLAWHCLSGQIISGASAPEPGKASKQLTTTTTTHHEVLNTLVQPVGMPVAPGLCYRSHIQARRERARMLLLQYRPPRREDRILLCCTLPTSAIHDGRITNRFFCAQVQAGGSFDVDYEVIGPDKKIVMDGQKERQGDFVFTATQTGEYQFCFNNQMSTFADKYVDFEISVRCGRN